MDTALQCISTANHRNEVMTLHPLVNVSTLPLHVWGNRDSTDDTILMKAHLEQCFAINAEKVKCKIMVFCFDKQDDYNGEMALKCLRRVVRSQCNELVKTVMVSPYVG